MVKGRLILEAAVTIALAVSSLVAVSTNDNLKVGISAALQGGADLAARTDAAVTNIFSDLAANIQGNFQAVTQTSTGVDASVDGGARTEGQGAIDLNLGGGGETSAESETRAQGSVRLDFDQTLQAMFNALGFEFETLLGFDFGS